MSHPQISLSDVFRMCRNAVRYFPEHESGLPCQRLNAWRVLHHDPRLMLEIGTGTLGAVATDKDSPFFWSKIWEESGFDPGALKYRYPVATGFEIMNKTTGTGHVFDGNTTRTHLVEFSVLDVFQPDACKIPGGDKCDGRPINQIFMDTESLLDGLLRYLGATVIATVTGDTVPKIYNKEFLEVNFPGQYSVVLDIGSAWKSKNPEMVFSRVEYPTKQIYGTKCRFTFTTEKCPDIQFNHDVPDPKVIGFEAGCHNC